MDSNNMYIRTTCPICKSPNCVDILIREKVLESGAFPPTEIIDVEVMDACTLQDLTRDVLLQLSGYVYNGITKAELCKILKDKFSILERYCCDIIQQLKIELGLYCKEGVHLNFVP
ncbi:MAG: hypothetical protein A4E24_01667 [Methanomethylovorans sp. PtaU1.Bin093]|uniref:hypothetical protein n=1 Tax=Methanomethylovorans sp. PtaU1.Bin093 TaxID=1811679 RepID=UPI0009C72C47|nr:hypothetical protein [Methanomethylovorans sp. PtaU1.Bin093]OPY19421.1 MAG: hypothetical protein A4E24_01667 [Methanomethylovorans sp. PtaU1.Bin093]